MALNLSTTASLCTRQTCRKAVFSRWTHAYQPARAQASLAAAHQQTLHREQPQAQHPNPDPSPDSQTARLVDSQAPYMVPTYVRPSPMFQRGEGCYLFDVENRAYLDFTSGIAVNALGHCDEGMAGLIAQQARTLVHTSNLYHNPWTGSLSRLLVEKTREAGGMSRASKAFICNSGSEANEAAIKFARKYGKAIRESKTEIVSFQGSFHGRTMGSLSATPNQNYQKPFGPMVPGFRYGTFNDHTDMDQLITEDTCGVLVEPIQGEGGINVATAEFLIALRRRCTQVNALLIYDEIQCGLSRTGTLWAHAQLAPDKEAHPDILTTAKALGNGYPIGATIVTDDVSDKLVTGDHGTTFGGNPLGSRIAHYVVTRLSDPKLQQSVVNKEAVFRRCFERIQKRLPRVVIAVRGRGLILGLQLACDPTPAITAARERGLLVISCGTNTLRFVPPLIITEQEIEKGMAVLEDAMVAVFGDATGERSQDTD